jgi:hypothetical protein
MLKSNVIQQGTHLSDANHQTHPFSHVGEDFQERMIVSPPRCDVAILDSDHGNWDKKESFLEPRRLFTNLLDGCERYGYNDNRNRSSSRHRQEARRLTCIFLELLVFSQLVSGSKSAASSIRLAPMPQ